MSCDYLEKLDAVAGARYRQKLAILGTECPYTFAESVWRNNTREWPLVEYPDVYHYLVKTPGVYTGEEMGNYKSLRSKNLLMSGWVHRVYHHKVAATGVTIFKADVTPSYRINAAPHHPWVAVATDGTVITGHCDCKAGLGESCTHVGGLLYKIEMTCRMGLSQSATCTDQPCTWNQVEWSGVQPARLAEMEFYTSDAKVSYKEKAPITPYITPRHSLPSTEDEKNDFLISLLASCNKVPVGLSLFSSTAGNLVSSQPVCRVKKVPRPLKELIQQPGDVTLHQDDIAMVEEVTRSQSSSITWHEQRAGRITSSVAHNVLHTNPKKPAKSLIFKISCMSPAEIHAKPLMWGREHEKDAIQVYINTMEKRHTNFKYKKCGLHIHPSHPCLAASPDGLVLCDCCGAGVVEAKCPYNLREVEHEHWAGNPVYPLVNDTLPQRHPHYTQVQHHMFVTGREYCDYIIWSPKATTITRVERDSNYGESSVPKLREFWSQHIKSELLSGKVETEKYQKDDENKENQVYCICGKVDSTKPMIGCDSDVCPNKWFHWDCVGLVEAPKKKTWYCSKCQPTRVSKRRKVTKKKFDV